MKMKRMANSIPYIITKGNATPAILAMKDAMPGKAMKIRGTIATVESIAKS
jgi:hypothetical protein